MQLSEFSLLGKVALVTGCSRGLGEAIAIGLVSAGAEIAGVDLLGPSPALARHCSELGKRYSHLQLDLQERRSPTRIIESVVGEFGSCDILVNNAGIIRRSPAVEFTDADWDDVMDVNLRAPFFLSREFARLLLSLGRPGKIIFIASMLSFQGSRNVVSYTASKSGVAGMTRALANEFAPHGINVNAIAPGYMDTENTRPLTSHATRAGEVLKMIPAGRWGRPDDLAGPAVFLASRASDYLNGAVIPVDGGWLSGNV